MDKERWDDSHDMPVSAAKTTGPEMTGDSDDDEPSSRAGWKKNELTVLMHVLQEVSGIEIADQVSVNSEKEFALNGNSVCLCVLREPTTATPSNSPNGKQDCFHKRTV